MQNLPSEKQIFLISFRSEDGASSSSFAFHWPQMPSTRGSILKRSLLEIQRYYHFHEIVLRDSASDLPKYGPRAFLALCTDSEFGAAPEMLVALCVRRRNRCRVRQNLRNVIASSKVIVVKHNMNPRQFKKTRSAAVSWCDDAVSDGSDGMLLPTPQRGFGFRIRL